MPYEFQRILVDADSLLYRCGFAAEGEPVSHACHNLKSQINQIKDYLGTDNMDLFIKGKGNFRTDIAVSTVYKGTRPSRVPTMYPDLRKYIIEVHGAKEVDGMEADDAVSVELWNNRDSDSGVILAAMDKDLWNTPGWHFNYDPRKWTTEYVPVAKANRNFLKQLLIGDRSDNVPGLPRLPEAFKESLNIRTKGIGEKTAEKILECYESNKTLLQAVYCMYMEYGEEEGWDTSTSRGYFTEQGQLLWMTRELDAKGKPVLWEPPAWLV